MKASFRQTPTEETGTSEEITKDLSSQLQKQTREASTERGQGHRRGRGRGRGQQTVG